MLPKRTTFVLGAGVSFELKFPLGETLKNDIRNQLKSNGRPELSAFLTKRLGAGRLSAAIEQLHSALAYDRSIDAAMQGMGDRPDVVAVGKAFIAAEILTAERNSDSLRNVISENFLGYVADTGLFKIISAILANVSLPQIAAEFEKLTIVSFNYDRSFEQLLYMALVIWKHASETEAAMLVQGLRIWHPYGRLPALPWEQGPSEFRYRFGADIGEGLLEQAWETICTIGDGSDTAAIGEIAFGLSNSDRLIILGCAAHPSNFSMLYPEGGLRPSQIYATAMGSHHEPRRIREQIMSWPDVRLGQEPIIEAKTARDFADEYDRDWTR